MRGKPASISDGAAESAVARPGRAQARRRLALLLTLTLAACQPARVDGPSTGGELRLVLRADPRTFNPVAATDAVSAGLLALLHGTLFRVDAVSQDAVPDLAASLEGPDANGAFTLILRDGVVFSDGQPFGAADVDFSLAVAQDPEVGAPQLQALRVGGRAVDVTILDPRRLRLLFGAAHPDPARLLAGVPMLPRHVLEVDYRAGTLRSAWSVTAAPSQLIGLGPFRLIRYQAGQEVILARNERYWRRNPAGDRLPSLDRILARVVTQPEAQVARLLAGDVDVLSALDTRTFGTIQASAAAAGVDVYDLGPSLEYAFLTLNLDDPPSQDSRATRRARWFHDATFRRALSRSIDRDALVRLVYDGRATALGSYVSPGNTRWFAGVAAPDRSVAEARRLLAGGGFRWSSSGRLVDPQGVEVSFSILTSTSNPQRQRIASVIQADLDEIGITVQIAALEFRALVDRVTRTRDFDTAIMALGGGDADPGAELSVWTRDGATHLFRLGAETPLADWESEIDALMRQQSTTLDPTLRHRLYARVQAIVAEQLPIVPLVSPHHLVAARRGLNGLRPGVTSRDSLWNVDEWWWSAPPDR